MSTHVHAINQQPHQVQRVERRRPPRIQLRLGLQALILGSSTQEDTRICGQLEYQNSNPGVSIFQYTSYVVALLPDRVRGLLNVKGRLQTELAGVEGKKLAKWLGGFHKMQPEDLKRLAVALDSTSDYLIGLGEDYRGADGRDNYALAAAKMSFAYFSKDLSISQDLKRRCRRIFENDDVLLQEGAPRTAAGWRMLARMIDLATPPQPARIAGRSA